MAKHDVTKTQFSQKFLGWFFWNFSGGRQIDAGEGTERFVSISVAVFELSRKSGMEGNISPAPQRDAG